MVLEENFLCLFNYLIITFYFSPIIIFGMGFLFFKIIIFNRFIVFLFRKLSFLVEDRSKLSKRSCKKEEFLLYCLKVIHLMDHLEEEFLLYCLEDINSMDHLKEEFLFYCLKDINSMDPLG